MNNPFFDAPIPKPNEWGVTPETTKLSQHWRHHNFTGVRPFFCQVEAVETAIWLTEVAPDKGKAAQKFPYHLRDANEEANPGVMRLELAPCTDVYSMLNKVETRATP